MFRVRNVDLSGYFCAKRQIVFESLFKSHIAHAHLELNSKAGRTRQEIMSQLQVKELHKLSSNENALGPSPKAMEAVKACLNRLHEYDYRTDDPFREALSDHFSGAIKPEEFVTTNSGLEVIELVMQGFLDKGDEVIISNPTFHVYEIFAEIVGAKIVDVPLGAEDFSLDVEGILKAITEQTKMLVIVNPNNPTGTVIPKSILDDLLNRLPKNIIVLIDEVYYHFSSLSPFPKALDYIREGKPVIGMHSFSKAYGLAGIRLAYGFCHAEIANYLQKLRRPFFINTMTMEAGMAALKDLDHIQATQDLIRTEKQKLYKAFDRMGLRYWESHTNFILVKPEQDHMALIDRVLKHGVMVRSGDNNGAKGCIRITIGLPESNEALIKALDKEL